MFSLADYHFFHPVEVRYADIDAQRHLNNAEYFTYMEQARVKYLQNLGLWNGKDFGALGIILVEASCAYKAPVAFGQTLNVAVRIGRLGNKSFELFYSLQDAKTGEEMAGGRTVQVAYDYSVGQSIPIPEQWRLAFRSFERLA